MAKKALEGLKGVSGATVSFEAAEARVSFDPAVVTVDQMIAALGRVGFQGSLKRLEEPGQ